MKPLPEARRPVIGAYQALAELGEGAMGMVFLARGPGGELAAVKRIHPHLLADKEFRARFRREVAASRKVDSAWAVPVIDADTEAEQPWFASAFVPGPTLAEVLAAGVRLPEPAVLRLAAGLARALADFAVADVIHRDLKPSNILLAADGPRVLDFGIARAADPGDGTGLTRTGWVLGTPAYMSPEQARAKPVTAASDVFSVGSVLVAAHTGSGPFDDPETLQTMFNVVHAKADVSGLPPRLRRIVSRCLAKQPRQRPDAAELARLAGEPPAAQRPWPPRVHELIAASGAALAALRQRHPERTTLIDTGPTLTAATAATLAEPEAAEASGIEPAEAVVAVSGPVEAGPPESSGAAPTEPVEAAEAESAAAVSTAAEPPVAPEPLPAEPAVPARSNRLRLIGTAAVSVAAVVIGLLVAFGGGDQPPESTDDTTLSGDDSRTRDFQDVFEDYEPDEPDIDDTEAAVRELPAPCSSVSAEAARDFGLGTGAEQTGDAWRYCSWSSSESDADAVGVNLGFALAPYTDDDEAGRPATVKGIADATMHDDEKPGTCTVQWRESFGYVLVTGAGPEESADVDACGLAVDFAELVVPDLPR